MTLGARIINQAATGREPKASECHHALGETAVHLPLGGLASTDPAKVRAPLVRPFWLLAVMAGALAVLWFRVASSALARAPW